MHYLYQHKSSYYFRLGIPKDLQPILGLKEIKKSPGKINRYKARILTQTLALQLKESFEQIRTNQAMSKGFKLITFKDMQSGQEIPIDHGDPEQERKSVKSVK